MKKFGLVFAFTLLLAPALASAAGEWSVPVQVLGVQVYSDPTASGASNEVVVRFDKLPFNGGCPYAVTHSWYVVGNGENVGRMVALLTAAKLSKSNVRIYRSDANDCRINSSGEPGYPQLRGIELTSE